MKKTLLLALCLVLVLTSVALGALSISAETVTQNANVGYVYSVDETHPIVVDGLMDEAYTQAVPLLIDIRAGSTTGLYTQGVARFAWSKSENAIYCYVLINDIDVQSCGADPWDSDSVELFLHRGNNQLKDFECANVTAENLQRGRQYRIDGFSGAPSCYLHDGGEQTTYTWSNTLNRLSAPNGHMITDSTNQFGWYEGGWANCTFNDGGTQGYAVEFRIDFPDATPLADAEEFRFDIQVNDRYGAGNQINVYYHSAVRDTRGAEEGRALYYYDYFVLSEMTVDNDGIIDNSELGTYGRSDATTQTVEPLLKTTRVSTDRYSFSRLRTGTMPATSSTTAATNATSATTTAAGGNAGGGCGSSIAAGSSVIALALAGVSGFFAFRKRKDD